MKTKRIFMSALAVLAAVAGFAADNDVKVIAHRGYWTAPGSAQNSITALAKAAEAGCYGSEFDVWMTSDSVLVVNHDGWINGHSVQYTPAEVICAQKIENGETVPTLEQYFAKALEYPNLRLICEMKFPNSRHQESEMARKICEMAKKFNLEDRIDYITFSRDGMTSLKKYAPKGTPIYYLTGDYVPEQLKYMGAAGADYGIWIFQKHPEWVKQLHDLGMKVNVWTVDNEDGMKWCIDNGVDFITTNYPERFMEIQKTYKPQASVKVSGTIFNGEDNSTLIGAVIRVKGNETMIGSSDINGKFTVDVPQGAELEIAYVGYNTVTVKAGDNMQIVMTPAPEDANSEIYVKGLAQL